MNDEILLEDFVDEFAELMKAQLRVDHKRWGDEWRKRGIWHCDQHQVERFDDWVHEKYLDCVHLSDFPWLKAACEAMIGWIREENTGWELEDD